jgi:mannitol/fructose-specific phosphotransferase system IIA component (Ntr-type)
VGKPHYLPWWKRLLKRRKVVEELLARGKGFTLIVIDTQTGIAVGPEPEEIPESPETFPARQLAGRTRLSDYLRPDGIVIWEDPVAKEKVLRDLVNTLVPLQPGLDFNALLQKLKEREEQGSTFLNEGVALPHSRIDNLEKPLTAIGICHGGILDTYTANPIEVIFLLFSPKDETKSHLQLLAIAGRLMQNRILRNQLRKEHNAQEVYASILKFEDYL